MNLESVSNVYPPTIWHVNNQGRDRIIPTGDPAGITLFCLGKCQVSSSLLFSNKAKDKQHWGKKPTYLVTLRYYVIEVNNLQHPVLCCIILRSQINHGLFYWSIHWFVCQYLARRERLVPLTLLWSNTDGEQRKLRGVRIAPSQRQKYCFLQFVTDVCKNCRDF